MTDEELAIHALPEEYQQKMARYVLDGWSIKRVHLDVVKNRAYWNGTRVTPGGGSFWLEGGTLLTLLDQINELLTKGDSSTIAGVAPPKSYTSVLKRRA